MFYEVDQNNSFGRFDVDNKVCHRLFIEADSEEEALSKAEDLGCYWDGVAAGVDCPCCGDRWSRYADKVDLLKFATDGYGANTYSDVQEEAVNEWTARYGKFQVVSAPKFDRNRLGQWRYSGRICFDSVEEYAQYLADEYGYTAPDARIFYKNGTSKEIYSKDRSVNTDAGE